MLTKKQNLLETIRGGNPDRYVNSYEAFKIIADPILMKIDGMPDTMKPGSEVVSGWGVKVLFPQDAPGPFPVHGEGLTAITDVTKWKEQIKVPEVVLPESEWAETVKMVAEIDRDEYFVTGFVAPGIFEKLHYLMGIEDTMINFYEEPEAMKELIDFLADWEISYLEEVKKYLNPEALFHHDDWGSQTSSFFSPDMFEEFLLPAYKKVYGYAKEQGWVIMHHSDSYAANLVPHMIDMGMDIWQGVMSTNNIPELLKEYGGKITFMGGVDNGVVDRVDWTPEKIAEVVENLCREAGTKYFIPGTTMGGPVSIYPGVYDTVTAEIDRMSKEMFK